MVLSFRLGKAKTWNSNNNSRILCFYLFFNYLLLFTHLMLFSSIFTILLTLWYYSSYTHTFETQNHFFYFSKNKKIKTHKIFKNRKNAFATAPSPPSPSWPLPLTGLYGTEPDLTYDSNMRVMFSMTYLPKKTKQKNNMRNLEHTTWTLTCWLTMD